MKHPLKDLANPLHRPVESANAKQPLAMNTDSLKLQVRCWQTSIGLDWTEGEITDEGIGSLAAEANDG